MRACANMPTLSSGAGVRHADAGQRRVGGRVDGRGDGDDLAGERAVAVRVGRRSSAVWPTRTRRQVLGRDVGGELDDVEVGHLDERLGGRAVDLLADAHQALHDLPGDRRGHLACATAAASAVSSAAERRLDAGLRRGLLRAGVLDLLAGGDAALEQALGPLEVELRVLERGLRLRDGGGRLALLILERPRIDLGDHLARPRPRRPRRRAASSRAPAPAR